MINCKHYTRLSLACLALLAVVLASPVESRQFRSVVPIATPARIKSALPDGAQAVDKPEQLDRSKVKAAVDQVLSKWNTGEMEGTLSDQFFDRTRLTDVVDNVVPRDAILRVQSVQGVQTLQQYVMPGDDGNSRVSIVSATVRTQLEYNDPESGYVAVPGVNEFILKVTEKPGY